MRHLAVHATTPRVESSRVEAEKERVTQEAAGGEIEKPREQTSLRLSVSQKKMLSDDSRSREMHKTGSKGGDFS